MMKRPCIALLAGASFLWPALAAAQPGLTNSTPLAVAPGTTTDLTLQGANLAGPTGLWLNFPATATLADNVENNGKDAAKVVYRVTVGPEVPVGVYAARVATPAGISNLWFLLVDDLPSAADNGSNRDPATAQVVTPPIAIDGLIQAESADYYKFTGKQGQRLTIEAVARRMASALDPVIRLLDAAGNELAYSDDEPGLARDSRLSLRLPADGDYLVEIRDIAWTGGGNHRYRLRIGDFPAVTTPFPLGVQRGQAAQLSFLGPAVEGIAAATVNIAADSTAELVPVSAKYPDGHGSAFATVAVGDGPEVVETEPNNAAEQATPVTPPCSLNGRIPTSDDVDLYQFEAKKDQRLLLRPQAGRLGGPAEVRLRVLNADGGQLAETTTVAAGEASLVFSPPADGLYRVEVQPLHGGGPHVAYRVEMRPFHGAFSLEFEADRVNPPKGGVFVGKVTAARNGYDGPITLQLEDAPPGLAVSGNVIEEKKNEATLRVTLPENVDSGTLSAMRIVGTAEVNGQVLRAEAAVGGALKKQFATLAYFPLNVHRRVGLGVGPVFPDFFALTTEPNPLVFPQRIGSAKFKIKANRMNNFAEQIALAVEGLPEALMLEVKPIAKGQNEVELELKGPESLDLREYKIRITGSGTHQNQPKTVVLGEVPLRVIPPLQVFVAPAGALAAGGKQKVKISLRRFGDEAPAVAVTLKNLPTGVTAPADLMIPEGKNEIEIELTAAADAQVGKIENLVAAASATIKGQPTMVESPPAVLEVTAAQ